MALNGIENAVYNVRNGNARYWKIYENDTKRKAGGFVAQSSDAADLTLDQSMSDLYSALHRLTPDNYLLVSYSTPNSNRPIVDVKIAIGYNETRGGNNNIGIGGFSLEGIGMVTPENFEEAVEKKIAGMLEKQKAKEELEALKKEVTELKKQAREHSAGFKKGIASIGAALYPIISKQPYFKDAIQSISGLMKGTGVAQTDVNNNEVIDQDAETINGTADFGPDDQKVFEDSLEILAKDNPAVVEELALLAKLKKQNPDMYKEGVDFARSMVEGEQ